MIKTKIRLLRAWKVKPLPWASSRWKAKIEVVAVSSGKLLGKAFGYGETRQEAMSECKRNKEWFFDKIAPGS